MCSWVDAFPPSFFFVSRREKNSGIDVPSLQSPGFIFQQRKQHKPQK
jgi:hypothetical protein